MLIASLFTFAAAPSLAWKIESGTFWKETDAILSAENWENTGATLPASLNSSQVAIIGEYVYLLGGQAGRTVYRAPLSSPTAWEDSGATLPATLGSSQVAIIGEYAYLFGGTSNVIYRASLTSASSPSPEAEQNFQAPLFRRSSSSAPSCSDSIPQGTPDLFQVDVNSTYATVYFSPVLGSDSYFISYGEGNNAEIHGVQFDSHDNSGVIFYRINDLLPNTDYTFKVRANHGCATGSWSNELKIRSSGSTSAMKVFYKGFAERVLSLIQ